MASYHLLWFILLQNWLKPHSPLAGDWQNDGSCLRLQPVYRHHIWSSDFVADSSPGASLANDLAYGHVP
jgi:hypothetical protein